MTNELRDQRRWERIAGFVEAATGGRIQPVVMPLSESGGMLVVQAEFAFHFTNAGDEVNVDVLTSDSGVMIAQRPCFPFSLGLGEIVKLILTEELIGE